MANNSSTLHMDDIEGVFRWCMSTQNTTNLLKLVRMSIPELGLIIIITKGHSECFTE